MECLVEKWILTFNGLLCQAITDFLFVFDVGKNQLNIAAVYVP